MTEESILDRIPLWIWFILTVAIVLLSVEIGFRLGRIRRRRPMREDEKWVDATVSPTLGLLAFMLAFAFGMAQARHDDRRTTLFESANAIGTAYLRADLAPEPYRSEMRRLLRAEIDVRLRVTDGESMVKSIAQVTSIHDTLWRMAVASGPRIQQGSLAGLEVQSVNEVIDSYERRVAALFHGRVPLPIWFALHLLAVIGTGLLGYAIGLSGSVRSPAVIPLALAFTIVMLLIADLNRPYGGLIQAGRASLVILKQELEGR